jgi:hypothetical protein
LGNEAGKLVIHESQLRAEGSASILSGSQRIGMTAILAIGFAILWTTPKRKPA